MSEENIDPVELARANEARGSQDSSEHSAGWYPNPDADGQRYWDGSRWMDSFAPPNRAETKMTLWGLSLGFGATGAVGAVAIPLLAFYFPLGFGIGGAALGFAAMTSGEGETPWWAWVAVVATIVAIVTGLSAYSEFSDNTEALEDLVP